ncbi:MAG: Rhodanese-related sulfurtransferase [Chloroflexi bacterium]|jgi:rhodanese-related sulfurtransferase|nr:MAG: Rhodanese-related sulfurtransferase [Chloroflexota bacterium]
MRAGVTVTTQEPFEHIDVDEASRKQADGATLIDCREEDEYAAGHAAGAPLIPHMSVFQRADEIEKLTGGKDQPLMFICKSGQRSAVASEFAAAAGFTKLYNVEGGTEAWVAAGLPTE